MYWLWENTETMLWEDGTPILLEEYFEEDQQVKRELVDRSEDGLRQVNRDGVTGGLAVGDKTPEKSWRN